MEPSVPAASDHDVGRDEEVRRLERLAPFAEQLVVHDPPPVAPLQRADRDLGEDLGAVVPGVGQVVHERRVLRPVVAAGDAVAAVDAGLLLHAGAVRARPRT